MYVRKFLSFQLIYKHLESFNICIRYKYLSNILRLTLANTVFLSIETVLSIDH